MLVDIHAIKSHVDVHVHVISMDIVEYFTMHYGDRKMQT